MGVHESVLSYLKESGCSPSLSGFKILSGVMELDYEKPGLSIRELFDLYIERENIPSAGKQAQVMMRAAKYCFAKSLKSGLSFEGFIRGFSAYMKGEGKWEKAAGSF